MLWKKTILIFLFILLVINVSYAIRPTQPSDPIILAQWTFDLPDTGFNETHAFDNIKPYYNITNFTGTNDANATIVPSFFTSFGNAMHFDGIDDYYTLGEPKNEFAPFNFTNIILSNNNKFSVSGWLRYNKTGALQYPIDFGLEGSAPRNGFSIQIEADDHLQFNMLGTSDVEVVSQSFDAGDLIFFLATYNGTHGRLFTNKSNEILHTVWDPIDWTFIASNIRLGVRGFNAANEFNGTLDEVVVWNESIDCCGTKLSALELYNDYLDFSRAIELNITYNETNLGTTRTNNTDIQTTIVDSNTIKITNNLKGYINLNITIVDSYHINSITDTNNSQILLSPRSIGYKSTNLTSYVFNDSSVFIDLSSFEFANTDYKIDLDNGRFTLMNSLNIRTWLTGNVTEWEYEYGEMYVRDRTSRTMLGLIPLFMVLFVVSVSIIIVIKDRGITVELLLAIFIVIILAIALTVSVADAIFLNQNPENVLNETVNIASARNTDYSINEGLAFSLDKNNIISINEVRQSDTEITLNGTVI